MRIFSKKFTPISVNLKVAMRFFYVFEKQWNSSLFLYLIYRGRSILPLSLIKFSRQAEKASANFFRRENTRCTFSSRRHLCFRLGRPAHSLPAPAGQHLPPPFFSYRPTILSKPTPFLPAWPADALHSFPPLF